MPLDENSTTDVPARSRRDRLLSWAMNLAGVVILAVILILGGADAWRKITQADWRPLLAALGFSMVWYLVAAYRWTLIARQMGPEAAACPFRYYVTYHMLGMLTGQVVPVSVGMLGTRPLALNLSQGVPLRRAALSVFLDKTFDVLLALILVLPVALYLADWVSLGLSLALMGAAALLGAIVIGWRYERALGWAARAASRLARPLGRVPLVGPRLIRRLPAQLDRLSTERVVTNRLAAQVYFVTVVLYLLVSVRFYFIAEALRLEIPLYLVVMGSCVTQLTLIFSFTPGSLGFLEAGWVAVLGLAGLSAENISAFLIGRRAFVLLFTAACTLLAFAWIRESPARLFRAVRAASRRPAVQVKETAEG